jgi:hypothetical protein
MDNGQRQQPKRTRNGLIHGGALLPTDRTEQLCTKLSHREIKTCKALSRQLRLPMNAVLAMALAELVKLHPVSLDD